jgi:hypothetical protein
MMYRTNPRLNLFEPSTHEIGVEKSHMMDFHPIGSLSTPDAPIEFDCHPSSEEYTDLASTLLQLNCSIRRVENSAALTEADDPNVTLTNLPLASLFRDVTVKLNQRVVSGGDQLHPYRAMLQVLTVKDSNFLQSLTSAGFFADTPGHSNTRAAGNAGFRRRVQLHSESASVQYIGPLFADIFSIQPYLLNQMSLQVKLTRHSNEFSLLVANNNNTEYKIVIDSAVLHLRRLRVNPTVALAHEQGLLQRNALYHFDRHELQTVSLAAGTRNKSLDSITHGQLPKFLLVAMVSQAAFNGSRRENPFWFRPFSLSSLNLFVNGEPIAGRPVEPVDGQYSCEFVQLMRSLQGRCCLSMSEFSQNSYLLAFDLSPSGQDSHRWFGHRQGQLRMDVRFSEPLENPVILITMATYDSCIEITKEREVLLDFRKP